MAGDGPKAPDPPRISFQGIGANEINYSVGKEIRVFEDGIWNWIALPNTDNKVISDESIFLDGRSMKVVLRIWVVVEASDTPILIDSRLLSRA